jgi:hypothetical protein
MIGKLQFTATGLAKLKQQAFAAPKNLNSNQ